MNPPSFNVTDCMLVVVLVVDIGTSRNVLMYSATRRVDAIVYTHKFASKCVCLRMCPWRQKWTQLLPGGMLLLEDWCCLIQGDGVCHVCCEACYFIVLHVCLM